MKSRHVPSKLLKNVLLLAASLMISLLAVEAILARFAPQIKPYSAAFRGPRMPFTSSPYLPATSPKAMTFDHRSPEFDVSYSFNALGYRGSNPRTIEKPPGVTRILCVGDSFTLGWGNAREDTFVQHLANSWEHHEVINAGYRGYISPDAYYAYLNHEGMALSPDLVLIALYSGNDVEEIRDNQWHALDERRLPRRLTTIRLYTDYHGDFIFPPGARKQIVRWQYRTPVLRESRAFVGIAELATRLFDSRARPHRSYELFGLLRSPGPIELGWRKFERAVDGLNDYSREQQVEVVYAVIPPHPNWKNQQMFHAPTVQLMQLSGARVLDLGPFLGVEDYYREGHLNARGNARVAAALLTFLGSEPIR